MKVHIWKAQPFGENARFVAISGAQPPDRSSTRQVFYLSRGHAFMA